MRPPTAIGGYRVYRLLGSGAMGSVYAVQDPSLPRLVALKLLSGRLSADPSFRARFIREAEVASVLAHPNIVSVYNRGQTDDGQLWIAMEYVDGTDADAAVRAGLMTPPRALHVVTEIAKALDYAHARQIVHRDVKPANFLLSGPPGEERVLLADFGIARALDDIGMTATDSVLATVAYAAPEVLSGRPFDGRADVYSLGCSLFRLLTGRTPFPTDNGAAAMVMAHLHHDPPRVTAQAPHLPVALDAVIGKAMAKDPAARFQSAQAFADAASSALLPGPSPQWQQPSGPRRRSRRGRAAILGAAATGTAVVIAVAAGVGIGPFNSSGQGSQTPTSPSPTRTTRSPTTTTSAAATLTVAELAGLLPKTATLNSFVGGGRLTLVGDAQTPVPAQDDVVDRACAGAYEALAASAYNGTGFTGAAWQGYVEPDDPSRRNTVAQSVIAFTDADQAKIVFDEQVSAWAGCADRPITLTVSGGSFVLSPPVNTPGDFVTAGQRITDAPDRLCQRALGSHRNVIVDVRGCSTTNADVAATVVQSVLAAIPP